MSKSSATRQTWVRLSPRSRDIDENSPPMWDRTLYRMVVGFLGATAILTVICGAVLAWRPCHEMPDGLIALGSASVGALAGLLAPTPANHTH